MGQSTIAWKHAAWHNEPVTTDEMLPLSRVWDLGFRVSGSWVPLACRKILEHQVTLSHESDSFAYALGIGLVPQFFRGSP